LLNFLLIIFIEICKDIRLCLFSYCTKKFISLFYFSSFQSLPKLAFFLIFFLDLVNNCLNRHYRFSWGLIMLSIDEILHKRFEPEQLERESQRLEQESLNVEAKASKPHEPIKYQLQHPEIELLFAEQERLRIEAERVWLEQERHSAEQVKVQIESESVAQNQYEANIQQLISKQRFFEPENQLSEKESSYNIETQESMQISDDLNQDESPLTGIFFEVQKQTVSSDVVSLETTDLPITTIQNHSISRVLPVVTLIFLMIGGAVLGVWFLRVPRVEEASQTSPSHAESNQTTSTQTAPLSYTSDPADSVVESINKINEVPRSTLPIKKVAKTVKNSPEESKPIALRMEKPMLQSRKNPPNRKRPITIDDLLNDK
jgi:hypothetical protein